MHNEPPYVILGFVATSILILIVARFSPCLSRHKTWHITVPGITFVIVILLIFRIGGLLNAGFEQILLLYSPPVYEVADTCSPAAGCRAGWA